MPIVASFNFICDGCEQSDADMRDVNYGYAIAGPDLPAGWHATHGGRVYCDTCWTKKDPSGE